MVGEITATQPSAAQNSAGPQLRLEPGLEVPVRVSAVLPGNVVRLSSGTASVEVRVSAPLAQGAEVTLKVGGEAGKPQIQLLLPAAQSGGQGAGQLPAQTAAATSAVAPGGVQTSTGAVSSGVVQQAATVATSTGGTLLQALAVLQVSANGSAAPVQAQQLPPASNAGAGQMAPFNGFLTDPAVPETSEVLPTPVAKATAPAPTPATNAAARPLSADTPGGVLPATGAQAQNPGASGQAASAPPGNPAAVSSPVSGQPGAAGPAGTLIQTAASLPPAGAAAAATVTAQTSVTALTPGGVPSLTGAAGSVAVTPSTQVNGLPVSSGALAAGGAVGGTPPGFVAPGAGDPAPAPAVAPVSASAIGGVPAGATAAMTSGQTPGSPLLAAGQLSLSGQGQPGVVPAAPPVGREAGPVAPSSPSVQTAQQGVLEQGQGQGRAPVGGGGIAPSPGGLQATPAALGPTSAFVPSQTATAEASAGASSLGSLPAVQKAAFPGALSAAGTGSAQVQISSGSGLSRGQAYPVALESPVREAASGKPVSEQVKQLADKVLAPLEEQQSSLATLFANLQGVLTQTGSTGLDLPKPVQTVIEQILGLRLGSAAEAGSAESGLTASSKDSLLSAEDVQRALELSGLFREMALRREPGKAAGGDDLKSLLMNLRKLLQSMGGEELPLRPLTQPRPPSLRSAPQGQPPAQANLPAGEDGPDALASRLLKDTDGALSRIRLEQLASRGISREALGSQASQTQGGHVSAQSGGSGTSHAGHTSTGGRAMDLVVDLPLAVGGQTAIVQMQIGRDPDHGGERDEDKRAWRLRFALDLTATGPMEAAVSLRGGSTYVSLWVDREEMHRTLNDNRESLQAAFADAGLDLQELRFIRGLPARRLFAAGASVDRQS